MKRLSLKSWTILLALSMVMTILVLPSCKSLEPAIVASATSSASAATHTHDTLVLHDSIYVREVLKGDTLYLTRIEYRDRWRTQIVHDTIQDTQVVEKVIELPPERYVPKFYKWCTGLLWAILVLAIGRFAIGRLRL